MFLLKILIFLKNLIEKVIIFLIRSFRLLFRFLFYKIFIKLYYWLFRLKRYEFKERKIGTVFSQKAIHVFAILLVFSVSIFSLTARTQAGFDPARMRNSIMAKAVITEFDLLGQEELIKETAEEFSFSQTGQAIKYVTEPKFNRPLNYLGLEEKDQDLIISDDESLAMIRPQQIDLSAEETTETISGHRTEIVEYEIKSGDTVSTIAQNFGLKVNTVLWANNLSAFSLIRPGNTLIILPTDGVLHTIKSGETLSRLAQIYNVNSQEIADYNKISGDALTINQKLIIPGGSRVRTPARISPATPSYTGVDVVRDIVSPAPAPASPTKMAWPTQGHRITQYFSWRHNGLDIANKAGTPIYAADAGVVEFAGWNTGYGNNIIIDHGGGKKTRYAHMSQMFVSAGQRVGIGEHIAAMGSTGWSTGPHLHFEVIINGVRQNPLNYIR